MKLIRALFAIALCLWLAPSPASAQTELIANGGFESFDSTGLATSWSRWWEDTPKPANGSLNYAYKPDWSPESNPTLVHSGGQSQHIGLAWDPWRGGVFQTITAPPGARIRLPAYGGAFASTPDFPNPSDSAVAVRMQIGADPNGGAEWWTGNVQWSGTANPHDTWYPFTLDVVAGASGRVTLFLAANYKGDSRYHLDVWWDSVSAQVLETAPTPTTTPAPIIAAPTLPVANLTATPASPTPLVVATEPPNIPTVAAQPPNPLTTQPPNNPTTGQACVTVFDDTNGNGAFDRSERLLAAAQIRVVDSAGNSKTHITDGASEPHCFGKLTAGAYIVSAALPAGYNPTTGDKVTFNLEAGGRAEIQFGAQSTRIIQLAPSPTPIPQESSETDWTLAAIAIAVLAVVLIAAGIVAAAIIVRQR